MPDTAVDGTELMWAWLRNGWRYRLARNPAMAGRSDEYRDRIQYEMSVILDKEFTDYFLIVSDIVRWAKDNGEAMGPGRGSAAASLVCYFLRITEIDPLDHPNMLFERFLDPTRDDWPDIDLDFADDSRHRVHAYAVAKYGADCVGNVANFSRFRGKTAIKDIARVYRIPKWAAETVSNLIIDREAGDPRINDSVHDTLEMFPAAQAVLEKYPQLRQAEEFEGDYRSMSVHAGGIVISARPLTEVCALYTKTIGKTKATKHEVQVIPADKKSTEYLGMQKLDFLGLSTMGAVRRMLEIIGMPLEELYQTPLDDPAVLQAFRSGDVTGIFQFEGHTQRGVTHAVQPETPAQLYDISALARPGPLSSGEYEAYVARRHGRLPVPHVHPIIDDITSNTYGTVIYQEHVFRILALIGGFDGRRIGEIRRIISGKLGEAAFNTLYQEFEQGAADNHQISAAMARTIWNRMTTASRYLFNYAHACSYSILAIWLMWLKVHHPLPFYSGALVKVGKEKLPRLMQDVLNHDIAILPPDPELSTASWEPATDHHAAQVALRAGLLQIPGIGDATVPMLLDHRNDVVSTDPAPFTWDNFIAVKGIGPKKVETMREFAEGDDPFGLMRVSRVLAEYRQGIANRLPDFRGLPAPTHTSEEIPEVGQLPVVWMGFVKDIRFDNEIEKKRKYGDYDADVTDEDILAELKDAHLLESAVLFCYDEGETEVKVRVNRWAYPILRELVHSITPDVDVIIASGTKKDVGGFGVNVYAYALEVLEPDDAPGAEEEDEEVFFS